VSVRLYFTAMWQRLVSYNISGNFSVLGKVMRKSGGNDSSHSGGPFLIRCQLAGRDPMEVGAAGRNAVWVADRSP
jgi:hypothetical protein